jgi:hypothetical protein
MAPINFKPKSMNFLKIAKAQHEVVRRDLGDLSMTKQNYIAS